MPRLILNPGTESAQPYDLQAGTYKIGRHAENSICIPDGSVSGTHCELLIDDGSAQLTDLGSTNGTFVDGQQVQQAQLRSGQSLRFGSVTGLFQAEENVAASVPGPEATTARPSVRMRGTHSSRSLRIERQTSSEMVPSNLRGKPVHIPTTNSQGKEDRPKRVKHSKSQRAFGEPNLSMGITGAVAGAVVGMLLWFGTIKLTGMEIGIIAWAVGIATGFGCRILGGGYSRLLGFTAAALTFFAIIGGQYLAGRAAVNEMFEEIATEVYEEAVQSARTLVAIENDDELKAYLSDEMLIETEGDVTDEELAVFRKEELPDYQELVSGSVTREEFTKRLKDEFYSVGMTILILKESVSLWTLLWLFLGVGSAWRLGIGEDAD